VAVRTVTKGALADGCAVAQEWRAVEVRNPHPSMQYRRFGKTERRLSAITLGGMRFAHGWERPRESLPPATIENCRDCVTRALDAGINHFETAYGYVKSEHVYGRVLAQELRVPRQRYHLMTKGAPKTADETKELIELQLKALQTDHIDHYAWHGLNHEDFYRTALAKGGPVETLHALKAQGVIGDVGFSTHAPREMILRALDTDLFAFINLHYYYFFQRNAAVIERAAQKDMGVFIISPNDKGGRLYDPPALLRELTAPLTPIQWNARFCLSSPAVHTLAFGMTAPTHFDEMLGVFPVHTPLDEHAQTVKQRLDARLDLDPSSRYEGYELFPDPSGIIIPEVLRLRRLWKCYDLSGYGRFRYNMLKNPDHWYPGALATEPNLANVDRSRLPKDIDVIALLREAHHALYVP
jgi:predicted aldo/keto reductase-like oxidoreductase